MRARAVLFNTIRVMARICTCIYVYTHTYIFLYIYVYMHMYSVQCVVVAVYSRVNVTLQVPTYV